MTMSSAEPGPGLERRLGRLQEIVSRLEGDRLELQDALELFEEGVRELREAQRILQHAELRIERLLEEPDGSLSTEPLEREDA
jgi:exodeoxyribonuclease VII small subunit